MFFVKSFITTSVGRMFGEQPYYPSFSHFNHFFFRQRERLKRKEKMISLSDAFLKKILWKITILVNFKEVTNFPEG